MVKDMTSGNPTKLILSFAVPMLIGNLFQQFYSMVDAIIVGRFIDVSALAAVGATGAMTFFVIGFSIGLTTGFSIIVSQRFGSGDEDGLRVSVTMSILLSIAVTIVLTVISVLGARPLLEFMNTPADIIDDAYIYLVIVFAGNFSMVFYNLVSSILRALGDSKTPLYFLILSSLINVVLDLVFIIYFSSGVAGAAYATVASQAISFILCFIYMFAKFPILKLKRSDWKLNKDMVKELLRLGIPTALQNSVTAIGVMVLQTAINGLGSVKVAAYTAASKVEQLATQPMMTFGMAMATYAGQNLGAGKIDRIRLGLRKCMKISMISCVIAMVIVIFFGWLLTQMFVSSTETEVIQLSQEYLTTIAFFFCVLGTLFIYRSTLQGIGNSAIPLLSGFMELVMRVAASLILVYFFGFFGICIASPIAWIGGTVPLIIAYYRDMKRLAAAQELYDHPVGFDLQKQAEEIAAAEQDGSL